VCIKKERNIELEIKGRSWKEDDLKTEIFQRELWSGTEGWKKRIKLTLC
jgi:hypothetical protein